MKRPIFFLLVALATTMITAIPLESISFSPCNSKMSPLNVTIPGPIVAGKPITFDISGTAPSEIPEGSTVDILFVNGTSNTLGESIGDFCKLYKSGCPVKENTAFDLQDEITAPNNLPGNYEVGVGILDPQNKTIMCAAQTFGR